MSKIAPCLWFDGNAEEAARLYTSLFSDAKILSVSRYGNNMPLPAGTVLLVEFMLAGQRFQALNGGPQFPFTEAISLSVSCADQAEVDRLWEALTRGGTPGQCGWLKDRFGVSWQIVPDRLVELQNSGDPVATARMFQAMLKMSRLDVAALERAYRGEGHG
jgi:predicted 3-demethylubiquinone-9 3-methyltransferase (glyoxalase superfamily)